MDVTDTFVFIFSIVDGMTLLFLTVYFIITLSDLECDYINATSCCSKLNRWVLPELVAHLAVTILLLLTSHWLLFLLNIPFTGWLLHRYISKPSGNIGLYDPAEIHNRHQLSSYMTQCMVKLGFHLLFFFFYLYSLIVSLLS